MSARHRRVRGAPAPQTAAATVAALTLTGLGPVGAAPAGGTRPEAQTSRAPSTCSAPRTPPSDPAGFTDVARTVFFTATDGVHGRELWKSNGTRAGTVLVKDIDPVADDYYGDGPLDLTARGRRLFFTADDLTHGRALWKSDGTRAGTVMVKDIDPKDDGYGNLTDVTRVGTTLFFSANDATHGQELWKSDGTKAGTVLVKDIDPRGRRNSFTDGPAELTAVGGTLFFTADDRVHGRELWKSDGRRAGTVMVADVGSGDPDTKDVDGPADLTRVGGRLFFTADDGNHGRELWTSDGTRSGTVMVEDIRPDRDDVPGYGPRALTGLGERVFFTANDGTHGRELWTSDGTAAGTVLVKDVHPGGYDADTYELAAVGGTLFFPARDGTHGLELWRSDGTAEGTRLVKDVHPDPTGGRTSLLAGAGGILFFTADDGTHGRELWRSNGTTAGTRLVEDINPGGNSIDTSYPASARGARNRLYFAADDGTHGHELWRSDGTPTGTVLVQDVNRGGRFRVESRSEADAVPRNGSVTVQVSVQGAGDLAVGPAGGSRIKQSSRHLRSAGGTTVTLEPTAKGMRMLRRALRQAQRDGREVGRLRVKARFIFTPCGGDPSSRVRRYVLELR